MDNFNVERSRKNSKTKTERVRDQYEAQPTWKAEKCIGY